MSKKKKKSGNASASVFGHLFQADVGIYLFLRDAKKIISLNLEGNYQDIEITLKNDDKIYCQAKSISSADLVKNRDAITSKLNESIESLSVHKSGNIEMCIYASNLINPLWDSSHFNGDEIVLESFSNLDSNIQVKINKYATKHNFDTSKFSVLKIPYNIDHNENVRRLKIIEEIEIFMHKLGEDKAVAPYLSYDLFRHFQNTATKPEEKITKIYFACIIAIFLLKDELPYATVNGCRTIIRQSGNIISDTIRDFKMYNFVVNLYQEQINNGQFNNDGDFIDKNIDSLLDCILPNKLKTHENIQIIDSITRTIINTSEKINKIKKAVDL